MRRERVLLAVALAATVGCSKARPEGAKPDDAGAVAPSVKAASPPATQPAAPATAPPPKGSGAKSLAHWERDYKGTLGERTTVLAHLERNDDVVTGSFRYGTSPTRLVLRGKAAADDSLTLEEVSRDGKTVTGKLALHAEIGDVLAGLWMSPDGTKTFPVKLTLRGIPAAPRTTFVDFVVRLSRTKGKPLTAAEAEGALEGDVTFVPKGEMLMQHDVFFSLASLYVADVDNDGTKDFVLVDKNTVATHNDMILGVWDADGDKLKELPFHDAVSATFARDGELPMYRDEPFLETTPEGTVMRLYDLWGLDQHGATVRMIDPCTNMHEQHVVLLWKRGTPKLKVTKGPATKTPCK